MATIGELKIHITTVGIPELEHLLAMLEANIENLPTIVVKAMTSLADSVGGSGDGNVVVAPVEIAVSQATEAVMPEIGRQLNTINSALRPKAGGMN